MPVSLVVNVSARSSWVSARSRDHPGPVVVEVPRDTGSFENRSGIVYMIRNVTSSLPHLKGARIGLRSRPRKKMDTADGILCPYSGPPRFHTSENAGIGYYSMSTGKRGRENVLPLYQE